MIRKLLLIQMLLLPLFMNAQTRKNSSDEPDDNQIEKYLKDGRGVSRKNLIRFRLGSAAAGYFGLSYERKVVGNIGVEAGFYVRPFSYFLFEEMRLNDGITGKKLSIDLQSVHGGMGLLLHPKYYFSGKQKRMNSGYFMGLRGTYRTFNADVSVYSNQIGEFPQKDVKASSTAILFTCGSHQRLGSRMVWGIEWGMGVGWDAYKKLDYGTMDANNKPVIQHTNGVSKFTSGYIMVDLLFGFLF